MSAPSALLRVRMCPEPVFRITTRQIPLDLIVALCTVIAVAIGYGIVFGSVRASLADVNTASIRPVGPSEPDPSPLYVDPRARGIVGPLPDTDPHTWVYLPGRVIIESLKRVDSLSTTALSRAQAEQICAAIESRRVVDGNLESADSDIATDYLEEPLLPELGNPIESIKRALFTTFNDVLTPSQLEWLKEHRHDLPHIKFSARALCGMIEETLRTHPGILGPHTPDRDAMPSAPLPLQWDWSSPEIAAGLLALRDSPCPVTRAQARMLKGPTRAYMQVEERIGDVLCKATSSLRTPQQRAVVKLLDTVRRTDVEPTRDPAEDLFSDLNNLGRHRPGSSHAPAVRSGREGASK